MTIVMPPGPVSCIGGTKYPHCIVLYSSKKYFYILSQALYSLLTVSSRLDYCNSPLYGISDGLLAKLQTVQMQQCVSWPEQRILITLHQCCIYYTDFQYVSESPSSWLWSPSSAFVIWRHLTWLTCFVGRQQVAVVVSWQQDTRRATYQDYDRSMTARLCCVGPSHMEQPPRQTADLSLSSRTFVKKTKIIYLAASASEDFCLTGTI